MLLTVGAFLSIFGFIKKEMRELKTFSSNVHRQRTHSSDYNILRHNDDLISATSEDSNARESKYKKRPSIKLIPTHNNEDKNLSQNTLS
jgi:hypothetical protein